MPKRSTHHNHPSRGYLASCRITSSAMLRLKAAQIISRTGLVVIAVGAVDIPCVCDLETSFDCQRFIDSEKHGRGYVVVQPR